MNKFKYTERWPNYVEHNRAPQTFEFDTIEQLIDMCEYVRTWATDKTHIGFAYSAYKHSEWNYHWMFAKQRRIKMNETPDIVYWCMGKLVGPVETLGLEKRPNE